MIEYLATKEGLSNTKMEVNRQKEWSETACNMIRTNRFY